MSNDVLVPYTSGTAGLTYAIVWDGNAWDAVALAWVLLPDAVFANCQIPLNEAGSTGLYKGDFPVDPAFNRMERFRVFCYLPTAANFSDAFAEDTIEPPSLPAEDYVAPDNAGIAAILAKVGTITGGIASDASVIVDGADQIVRRRTYSQEAGGRQLRYDVRGMDFTGAVLTLVDTKDGTLVSTGTFSVPDPGVFAVVFELDDDITSTLDRGQRDFEIVATYTDEPAHVAFVPVTVI